MKNIHVLPTDKPSRLLRGLDGIRLFENEVSPNNQWCVNVNIHVTNDEEIKDGDKRINNYQRKPKGEEIPSKKIILTTDAELIKDGIQVINDEFLQWFVKNPSCDFAHLGFKSIIGDSETKTTYKIIIPKEEFSKDEIDKFFVDMVCNPKEEPKPFKQMEQLTNLDWEKFKKSPFPSKKVPKQETLEEFAENYLNKFYSNYAFKDLLKPLLIDGAKWQAERMYREEEVLELLIKFDYYPTMYKGNSIEEINKWFEQFKKK